MISYSQNGEDVLLKRFFVDDAPQFYIDVGAAHPTFHSVTKHFYDHDWTGINIEPRVGLHKLLQAERSKDTNLNCAIAAQLGELTFYEVNVPDSQCEDTGGLSTLSESLASEYERKGYVVNPIRLQVRTLSSICEEHAVTEIGFLKVDVEGLELSVLQSLDWSKWRPRVIVAESTIPMSSVSCDDLVANFLNAQGYVNAFFDGLNRYYVRQEDADRVARLQAPANVLDHYMTYELWQANQSICRFETERKQVVSLLKIEDSNRTLNLADATFKTLNELQQKASEVEVVRQSVVELQSKSEILAEQKLHLESQLSVLNSHAEELNHQLQNTHQELAIWREKAIKRTPRGRVRQLSNYLQRLAIKSKLLASSADKSKAA